MIFAKKHQNKIDKIDRQDRQDRFWTILLDPVHLTSSPAIPRTLVQRELHLCAIFDLSWIALSWLS